MRETISDETSLAGSGPRSAGQLPVGQLPAGQLPAGHQGNSVVGSDVQNRVPDGDDRTGQRHPAEPASARTASGEREPLAARFHLAIFDDHLRSVELVEGTIVVGRSHTNHLKLNDTLLSRKHCSLTARAGGITLVDLNSSNGTFVNGEKVGTRELRKDDIIELGKTVMVVFDGNSWGRGEGLMNLRNPVKAQELIQRLREGEVERVGGKSRSSVPGIRGQKGLTDPERAFLRWLEQGENRLLPGLVADYLTHKLVSLLVRNSKTVRAAFTAVLEGMMRPEFFARFQETQDLRRAIVDLVESELQDLRRDEIDPAEDDRGLLEDPDGIGDPGGLSVVGEDTPAGSGD